MPSDYNTIIQDFMKVILMGYMGSGKSTLAKKVAEQLNVRALDLDQVIEEKEGCSIPEIFKTKGEIYFRKAENQHLNELLTSEDSFVLALGGGTPCYANNIHLIKSFSLSVYLKGSIETLKNRLNKRKGGRPLIEGMNEEQLTEFIAKHLFERRDFYEQAEIVLSIDEKDADQNATELVSKIRDAYSK